MEMKIVFVVVFVAAISTVLAHDGHHHDEAPAAGPAWESAPAPAPSSGAASVGSILGASLLSFVAYYLNFHA